MRETNQSKQINQTNQSKQINQTNQSKQINQTNQLTNKFLNMKKLFLLVAIAALGLASCSEESFDQVSQKDSNQIGFKTMVGMNSIFKSTELNNTAFTEFWVSAYRTVGDVNYDSTQTLIPYINNLRVVKINQATNEWNYTGNYYWPLSQKLNFFAHNAGASSVMPTNQFSNFPSFTFTQDFTSASTQKDVVIARALNQTSMATPVALTFNHVLCQINFSLRGADDGPEYVIKKIEVLGIRETGTFRFRDTLHYMWNT
ncbi:MAG: fimbrillin family protein, partial [Bacteroidales bacterium]|nr:fimbrillin family protein [Bacteroidales bacterium]